MNQTQHASPTTAGAHYQLGILSAGTRTAQFNHISDLARALPTSERRRLFASQTPPPQATEAERDLATFSEHAPIGTLATEALRQVTPSASQIAEPARIALLYSSIWGDIPATHEYLESMFDQDGRYASPRAFTRSIYSTAAATAAIALGIRGACQTLAFDFAPVAGMLEAAAVMLNADRADVVLLCWADQASAILCELQRRTASQQLGSRARRDVRAALLRGSVAIAVTRPDGQKPIARCKVSTERPTTAKELASLLDGQLNSQHRAVALAAAAIAATPDKTIGWLDGFDRGQRRYIQIC